MEWKLESRPRGKWVVRRGPSPLKLGRDKAAAQLIAASPRLLAAANNVMNNLGNEAELTHALYHLSVAIRLAEGGDNV